MIELIFIIVILGILAAVAIPKLSATRSEIEQAKQEKANPIPPEQKGVIDTNPTSSNNFPNTIYTAPSSN